MGSIIILTFVQNVFLFCLIFWALTWLGEWYSSPKEHKAKRQFYECGFKSISDLNITINLNFSLVAAFLILYDVEFTFLYPFLFNFNSIDAVALYLVFFFFALLILALIYDLNHSATDLVL